MESRRNNLFGSLSSNYFGQPHCRAAGLLICAGLLLLNLAGCGGKSAHPPARYPSSTTAAPTTGQVVGPGGEPGVYHRLESGQTLYRLTVLYDVHLDRLLDLNNIDDPTDVPAGSLIFIPGAERPLPYPGLAGARLSWPLRGQVTSRFGVSRGRHSHHSGLDIDGHQGDPIHAAAGGRVKEAGSGGHYGKYVLIDHGDGLETLYAHASKLLVKRGERVDAGEAIALVGRTGNSRGTHLHFEVRDYGRKIDPLPFLRGGAPSRAASQ